MSVSAGDNGMGGAHVQSVQALIDLEAALDSFGGRAGDALLGIRGSVEARRAQLEEREADAERDVSACREALLGAEDEDSEGLERALEDAIERRRNLRRWRRQVDEKYTAFRRRASAFERLVDEKVRGARHMLTDKIADLQGYHAIQLAGSTEGSGLEVPRVIVRDTPSASGGARSLLAGPLSALALPRGFSWVPLSQVLGERDLEAVKSPQDFTKVSYDDMREGMLRLRGEVLPSLHEAGGELSSDTFRRMDEDSGCAYEAGLQRVYEAFFGQHDYVYLVRRKGTDSCEIINGRHRIRMAQDLGWDAIPARVKDLNL